MVFCHESWELVVTWSREVPSYVDLEKVKQLSFGLERGLTAVAFELIIDFIHITQSGVHDSARLTHFPNVLSRSLRCLHLAKQVLVGGVAVSVNCHWVGGF